ncbi:MAG TPA: flagellar basal-body rod protein FlgF [Candidatus Sulfotelmatobacter sp.]|nr:flagellar basal-body rod protein FlgF [Candidatus Sulfotelmatobacter sp.]
MENSVYIGLSQQTAMRRQLDVIANNLANMNTTAFKSEKVLFREFLMQPQHGEPMSFVEDYGVLRDTQEGKLETTSNPLDVAINGRGYLAVSTPAGTRYTRNGHLKMNSSGLLTTSEGYAVLDDRSQPITLNSGNGQPTIALDGTISDNSGRVDRLNLVQFQNEQALQQTGSGLYATDQTPTPASNSTLQQGMIESSNVEPITEMTKMIELQRSYEAAQSLIQADNDRQTKSIESLAKFS